VLAVAVAVHRSMRLEAPWSYCWQLMFTDACYLTYCAVGQAAGISVWAEGREMDLGWWLEVPYAPHIFMMRCLIWGKHTFTHIYIYVYI
jgi:hypothetical protein